MVETMVELGTYQPTVFVVDDDASMRRALARLFSAAGLAVETFSGPDDFLKRVPHDPKGCIILDVKMPGTNGLELQHDLPKAGIPLPVIFVTAHADVPLAVRAMKEGALEVFMKPFDHERLMEAVRQALARDEIRHREESEHELLLARFHTLTPREREVMALVVTGMLNKQVAATLGTSIKTVKVHRAHLVKKMGADSLPDLVRMAVRLRLPQLPPADSEHGEVPKVQ